MPDLDPLAPAAARTWTPLPKKRRSQGLPRVSATFVSSVEDFHVEEIPAYVPCGEGEHAYLWLEKTNMPADALFAHVSRVFKVSRRDIGYAGLKDTRATTWQFLSVPRAAVSKVATDWAACAELLKTPQVRLVAGNYHQNKLRCGHLKGNRFAVTLRHGQSDDLARAQAIAERLQAQGMPNYYGDQRFGRNQSTLQHGLSLLEGSDKRKPGHARQAWLDKLALSAVQSALFNDYLALREQSGKRDLVLGGDILQVCASGGLFLSEDPQADQPRFTSREVVPAGPMFGPSMKPATDAADALEQSVLAAAGLQAEAFTLHKRLTQGTRRATLVWLDDMRVEAVDTSTLRLQFTLPSGSYATEVISEFTGVQAAQQRPTSVTSAVPSVDMSVWAPAPGIHVS